MVIDEPRENENEPPDLGTICPKLIAEIKTSNKNIFLILILF
jgi:hypothetical protein